MTPERKCVLRDIFLGLSGIWVVYPWGLDSPLELSVRTVGVITVVTAAVVWIRYLTEHRMIPERVADSADYLREHPGVAVLLAAALTAVLVLPLAIVPSTTDEYFAGIAGLYLGYIAYRLVYGVVRPVPGAALERQGRA